MPSSHQSHQSLPIYVQIAELLTRDIVAGRLINGERLPPERDMASKFKVSVGTLRKALKNMAIKGLIESVQGSGNYIRTDGDTGTIYAMFRLELLEGGGLPHAEVLDIRILTKPQNFLAFGTSDKGTRIRRVRSLNKTIVGLEEIWLDANAGVISKNKISENSTIKPTSKYGLTKLKGEKYIQKKLNKKIPFCIGRIFSFTSVHQKKPFVIPSIVDKAKLKKKLTLFNNTNHLRDFLCVSDVCEAIKILIDKKSTGIYNIGSGNKTLISDIIKLIFSKYKKNYLINNNSKQTCLVSNNSKIKKLNWKPTKNIKSIVMDLF